MSVDAILADWASPRLRAWARSALSHDPAATCDRGTLARQMAAAGLPDWPALPALEARFGGLTLARRPIGLYTWLRRPGHRPLCSAGGLVRMSPARAVWDPDTDRPYGPADPGTWLALIHDIDLDTGLYLDESGLVSRVLPINGSAYPEASSLERALEKHALTAEIAETRRRTDTGDCFVELDACVAAELAAALDLPPVPEASDDVSRAWWDGALAVREGPKFGDPNARATWLTSGDLPRLRDAARRAHALVLSAGMRVVGWPNRPTYDLARALTDAGLPAQTSTTYP